MASLADCFRGDFFSWPASLGLSNAVAVTATDQSDKIAFFAASGASEVDVGAPGETMWSLLVGDGAGSLAADNGNGTSFATPLVSGTMSLLLAQKPSLVGNAAAIKAAILAGVDSTGIATKSGGRLNVQKVLSAP